MIRINLVARIAGDKNSFPDLIYIAHQLKQYGVAAFIITFIGAIEDEGIYQNIIQRAQQLGVTDHIAFTKRSVPMAELPDELKSGYFFNFTVGSFMGYSSIEGINLGLKNIFCNCDQNIVDDQYDCINICPDIDAAVELLLLINTDTAMVDRQLIANNQALKKSYLLTARENSLLQSLILPNG